MKPELRFGLILGGMFAAFPLLLFVLGLDKEKSVQSVSTFVNLAITITVLYFAIRDRRDQEGKGFMSLGEGFGRGFKVSLVGAFISTLSSYAYFNWINPGIIDFMRLQQEEEMIARGASDAEVEQAMKVMEGWMSPNVMIVVGFIAIILLCLVISLILAAVLKKEDPSAEIS
jgi:hypothetical protein